VRPALGNIQSGKNADLVTVPDANSIATPNALRESDAGFRLLADTMPQMVWSTLPDGFHDYYNERWYEFTGMPEGSTDGEAWNGMFHPDDQERAWKKWRHSLATGEPYEVEYRLRHHSGAYRWTIGRALPLRDPDGRVVRWIGTCTDIDDAKRQAEQTEILSRELSHRIKNIFAVINGLIGLSVRRDPQAAGFADDLRQRIWALGRAHEFARPHSDVSRTEIGQSSLMGLLRELLRPYPALDEGRLTIDGADVPIDDRGATPLALIFHELATNAAKYGALSVADGRVALLSSYEGEDLVIEWEESGGPPLIGEPSRVGFGTKLVDMSVLQQVSGQITRSWNPDGLKVTLRVQPQRLVRA
jgi:PAS domain S-box-containing protein